MGHDAFAHHGRGSSALVIIGALHVRPAQTVGELVGSASVSRATAYRTLHRLADHGLVDHSGETWTLAPRALEGFGASSPEAVPDPTAHPAHGWDAVARQYDTAGVAARRKALHAAERASYREALERLSKHRRKAMVLVRDGRQVIVPAPRPDETAAGETRRTARRLLIEAGGTVRTTQQTLRMRSAAQAAEQRKLALCPAGTV
ncbi:hypothetical protein ABZ464_41055 [Streptomyces sp. NPDC005820]|uniref:hypothetical protein n=1 Tax=Streptomyces sp. NPDC005820 TaxID=3157069 RepID=UPI0033DA7913